MHEHGYANHPSVLHVMTLGKGCGYSVTESPTSSAVGFLRCRRRLEVVQLTRELVDQR